MSTTAFAPSPHRHGSALLASGLGLAAFGLAGTANAAPVQAPERVYCQVYHNGVPVYWYWGFCR